MMALEVEFLCSLAYTLVGVGAVVLRARGVWGSTLDREVLPAAFVAIFWPVLVFLWGLNQVNRAEAEIAAWFERRKR